MAKRRSKTRTRTVYVKSNSRRKNGNGILPFTIPVTVVASLGYLGNSFYREYQISGFQRAYEVFVHKMTGVDMTGNKLDFRMLRFGLVPLLTGILVHKWIGGGLGVNRALANSRLPIRL